MQAGERQRDGDTESEAGSRLQAVSTEPNAGLELTDHEIMTWAEVWHLMDWDTQVTWDFGFFTNLYIKKFSLVPN